ncbi:MAG TPA: VOC family protein [Xanthobacteraceae bacterium]|jgi:predicted enzyme related to lactoylglutathione lyase|nr:VOC family protein [Xanthobacteraceae bacterium]
MAGSAQKAAVEQQTAKANNFCWYELMATDGPAAEAFYSHVVGWKTEDAGMPGMKYTLLKAGDTRVAGCMTMPSQGCVEGAKPGWIGHVGVADIDATVKRVTAEGGAILREPTDIPNVGRFAIARDPQGAIFFMFQGNGPMPPQPAPGTPGTVGWHELYANDDWEKAFAFYSKLFGWTKSTAMPMGEMGTYQLFAANGVDIGGMMNKMPGGPGPMWNFYINVESLDAAVTRATEKGATVIHGPSEVPGQAWIVQCLDPQGVMFSMVAPKR